LIKNLFDFHDKQRIMPVFVMRIVQWSGSGNRNGYYYLYMLEI